MTMKKNLLTILPLLLFSLTAFGQLEKGNILLGGGVGFNSATSQTEEDVAVVSNYENSTLNFSPEVGYFFRDKWLLGLSLPMSWYDQKTFLTNSAGEQTMQNGANTNSFGVAPFVRKYFSISEKLSFFAQARIGYYQSHSEYTNYSDSGNSTRTSESNGVTFGTAAGMSFFPKKWLGVNLSISPLSYTTSSSQEEGPGSSSEGKSSGFDFGVDTSAITLGVNFFLSKK